MPRGTEFKHLHDLFHLALPRHEDSLTVLSINAPDVKGWFICPDLLSPLYTRQNLVELGLSAFVKVAGAGESVELFSVVCNPSKALTLTVICFTILDHRRIWLLPL